MIVEATAQIIEAPAASNTSLYRYPIQRDYDD